jgi:hypothetical protein
MGRGPPRWLRTGLERWFSCSVCQRLATKHLMIVDMDSTTPAHSAQLTTSVLHSPLVPSAGDPRPLASA